MPGFAHPVADPENRDRLLHEKGRPDTERTIFRVLRVTGDAHIAGYADCNKRRKHKLTERNMLQQLRR